MDLATEEKKKRLRSPAYPFINLETAVRRTREFYAKEGRGAAHLKVVAKHWGFEEKSSGGLQTAAALISFGLMQDEGTGDKRKVQLTQSALRIVLDQRPDSPDRERALRSAALAPKIHAKLWKKFGTTVSNEQLRHTLILDWEPPFNENTVDGFIKEYRDTIAFAKLGESDKVGPEVEDNDDEKNTKTLYVPKIGDYIQWEHNGVLGLRKPERVKGFSPDGEWAYVESQHGAVPTRELIPEAAPVGANSQPDASLEQRIQSPLKNTMQEMVVPLANGTKAVFQWPTSLTKEDVEDLKDSLKMLERKISRPSSTAETSREDL